MDPSFCVAALEEAIESSGEPAIFNTERFHQSLDYQTPEEMLQVIGLGEPATLGRVETHRREMP